jgi:hypothetical protein
VKGYRQLNENARRQELAACFCCSRPLRERSTPLEVQHGDVVKWITLCEMCLSKPDAVWRLRWHPVEASR